MNEEFSSPQPGTRDCCQVTMTRPRVRPLYVVAAVSALVLCGFAFRGKVRAVAVGALQTVKGRKTVAERVGQFGAAVHSRLAPRFKEIGVAYPPKKIILLGLKQERMIEVWVSGGNDRFEHLKTYPILAASGNLGPKLAEGDRQVPEGLYRIESLNPNSLYHLALRVNYPNNFDKEKGRLEGRTRLGSDIMVHGKSASVGCLAMGDQAAEDLFVMAAETGIENIQVILSPVDFRLRRSPSDLPKAPLWTAELYRQIEAEMTKLRK